MRFKRRACRIWLLAALYAATAAIFLGLPGAVPSAAAETAALESEPPYILYENAEVLMDAESVPTAEVPAEEDCCILHLLLGIGTLAVTVWGTAESRRRQRLEFETRRELL